MLFCPTFHAKSSGPILVDFLSIFPAFAWTIWSVFTRFQSILVNFSQFWSSLVHFSQFPQVHPPSKINLNTTLRKLRWHLLRWHLTLSEQRLLGKGLSGPLRLRVQSRSRTRLRIAASIAFLFRACSKGV